MLLLISNSILQIHCEVVNEKTLNEDVLEKNIYVDVTCSIIIVFRSCSIYAAKFLLFNR